jgi:hypothetical protein
MSEIKYFVEYANNDNTCAQVTPYGEGKWFYQVTKDGKKVFLEYCNETTDFDWAVQLVKQHL